MILFALVVWLLIIVLVGYVVDRLWLSMSPGRWYRYAVAPGEMVHQLSHVLGCFLAGADITGVKLYEPEGGTVTHSKPLIPLLGDVLISLAPLVGCPLVLYVLEHTMGAPFRVQTKLQDDFNLTLNSFASIFTASGAVMWEAVKGVFSSDLRSPRNLAFVYLASVLALRMAPTKADLKSSLHGIIFLAVAFIAIAAAGQTTTFKPIYVAVCDAVWRMWQTLSFGAGMLLAMLFVSILIAGIARAFRAAAPEGKGKSSGD